MGGQAIAERLAAGSARGLGAANVIAGEAAQSGEVLRELVAALRDERAVVTIRAATALNKVQQARPEVVTSYGHEILRAALDCGDLRTRWNLTIVVGRLPLKGRDRALAIELMFEALGSKSGFLRTFALTGLAEFAHEDEALRRRVRPIVEKALEDGSAAMRARARKLLVAIHGHS
jgi:hypothetical protein